jgi:S-DNA-T family DNA segregation ATPase FtsK/SpoIIIE
LLVLAAGLALVPVVLSFDPADPPAPAVSPAHDTPRNWGGYPGAVVARGVADLLGWGVYPTLGAWFVLVLTLLLQGRAGIWCWRLLGWLVLVPATCLAAELFGWGGVWASAYGGGGWLGRVLHQGLAERFDPPGVFLILASASAAGLALVGDALWPPLLRFLARRWNLYQQRRALRRAEQAERRRRLDQSRRAAASQAAPSNASSPAAPLPIARTPPPVSYPAPLPRQVPANDYQLPPFDLLEDPEPLPYDQVEQLLRERAARLEQTFADFGLNVRVVGINTGPVITQFEVALETGLRLQKVTRLADDIALNLKVPSVRMVAPIPGKDTVGVEIPNEHRAVVRLKEVILNAGDKLTRFKIPLFLGKDTEGRPLVYDLADMPHLLIAGRTGTGKSVCMNAIILSILMTRRPDEVRMIMIDPKMLELSEYGRIPHLMHPVVKEMRKAEAILGWAVDKMEERYDLLCQARVRNIAAYNELPPEEIYRRLNPADAEERERIPTRMPYIVIFVDEMNDLMMTMRKEVEGHIIRLAQKSRAAGIHLVVATQKPTVDVITGLIKSNLPARICFQVASRTDSRVVLDEIGAEKLLGKGDMLFLQPGTSTIVRAQGTYASDAEIVRVCDYLECEPSFAQELIQLSSSARCPKEAGEAGRQRDELYEAAVEVVLRERRGSTSLLQRALGIGYGRAARLIDSMAEDGIVGPYNGSNAREVLLTWEQWQALRQPSERS